MNTSHLFPFDDIRVLDISQGIAGPYCAQILWQHGADVIKVEPPAGDWGRNVGTVRDGHSALSITYNAGKRGLCLDAGTESGRALLRRLALQADVVVQNFRPGVAERMGVGYEALAAQKPDLVYVSISGYGTDGPYASAPASDSVMQADSGLMFTNQDENGQPRRIGMLLADVATALYAAQATSTALYKRLKTGQGSHVELSLLQACAALQLNSIVEYSIAGERPAGAVSAPNGVFPTADGSLSVLALNDNQFARLCRALDRPGWLQDERFADNASRMANRDFLHGEIAEQLRQQSTASWMAKLEQHEVLHAPVRDYAAVIEHPQAQQQGLFQALHQPGLPPLPFVTVPTPGEQRGLRPAPRIGEHSLAILHEAGLGQEEIDALQAAGVVRQAAALETANTGAGA